MSRVLAVHLTLELPLYIRCEPLTLAPHMQCNLELSQGTRQGHFLEGDGALGHREPCFLWALASVVSPTGDLVCPVVCFHHSSATACFKTSPASSPTVSCSSCCPVSISQVLPASQDLPWAVNSTIKQGLLPSALRCLGSAVYWARALLLFWLTSQSDGGSFGYCSFPTHLTASVLNA